MRSGSRIRPTGASRRAPRRPRRGPAALVVVAVLLTGGCAAGPAGTDRQPPSASSSGSAPASASASPSPSSSSTGLPATPAGWEPIYSADFDRDVPLGGFADAYKGWANYDGTTDTSRETTRPRDQVGLWDTATTVSVHDGVLDCRVHTAGRTPQVCAITPTPDGEYWRGQRYGRYVVRFRVDPVPGYKIAWLLWSGANDWRQGEVDFPEGPLDGTITGSTHRVDGDPADFAYFVDTGERADRWRTATIEWVPGRITFRLDDRTWTTTDPKGLPVHPMRWALQAETAIVPEAPDPAAEGHILIDWLVGYRYTG